MGFRIGGKVWMGPVLVLPEQVIAWPVAEFANLTVTDFQPLFDAEPKVEVILLGSGSTGRLIPSRLRMDIKATGGLSIDGMDTGAACRTYNVMLSEERRVAAALFPG